MTKKKTELPTGEDAVATAYAAWAKAASEYESASQILETVKAGIANGDLTYGYKELSEADAARRHAKLRYDGLLGNVQQLERQLVNSRAADFADELLAGKNGIQRDGLRGARRRLYESILEAITAYNRSEREHTRAVQAAVQFTDSLGCSPDSRLSHGIDDYGNLYVMADEVEYRTHEAISDALVQRAVSWALFEVREGYRHPGAEASMDIAM